MLERTARRIVEAAFTRVRRGSLTVRDHDRIREFGAGSAGDPHGELDVHSPGAWPLFLCGSRGLAEGYARGHWDSPDLVSLIRVAARNGERLDALRRVLRPLQAPWLFLAGTSRANSRRASRKQIAAHYDLGNDMFELMLDPTMSYSCAYFARPT